MNTPGFHSDVNESTYHADRESLSVSGAKVLLKAPALFRYRQDHPEHKAVFDFGSAAHAIILGAGIESIYVTPFDDWKTKAAQTERALAYEAGLSPILPKEWEKACNLAAEVKRHRLASSLLSVGEPEVSMYALDEPTGVMRRGRADWLTPRLLVDVKTGASSDPDVFIKSAVNLGYHMQAAYYTDLAADLGHPAEAFAFIVAESEPPHITTVIELPPELVEIGRRRNRRALERFRDCTESGLWPGYVADNTFAQPAAPRWALYTEDSAS